MEKNKICHIYCLSTEVQSISCNKNVEEIFIKEGFKKLNFQDKWVGKGR